MIQDFAGGRVIPALFLVVAALIVLAGRAPSGARRGLRRAAVAAYALALALALGGVAAWALAGLWR